MPLGPDPSLPGTFFHPEAGSHSQISPVGWPETSAARPLTDSGLMPVKGAVLRTNCVAAMPLSGNEVRLLKVTPGGLGTHPTHAMVGTLPRASTSNTSTDGRLPPWLVRSRWTPF